MTRQKLARSSFALGETSSRGRSSRNQVEDVGASGTTGRPPASKVQHLVSWVCGQTCHILRRRSSKTVARHLRLAFVREYASAGLLGHLGPPFGLVSRPSYTQTGA